MSATAEMIARVRLIVNEPTDDGNYTDELITAHIERYPCLDERGERPYTYTSDAPPEQDPNTNWIPTYDLYRACADIWFQKAAGVAEQFDFGSDDQSFKRQQIRDSYMKQARSCLMRARPTTMTAEIATEAHHPESWVINLPEQDA